MISLSIVTASPPISLKKIEKLLVIFSQAVIRYML